MTRKIKIKNKQKRNEVFVQGDKGRYLQQMKPINVTAKTGKEERDKKLRKYIADDLVTEI
jgi:hypothetical protein